MITRHDFERIRAALGAQAEEDITWADSTHPPRTAEEFALETIFVICNSGMKATVARGIYDRCIDALARGEQVIRVFGHVGKARAIDQIWADREALFNGYCATTDKLEYLLLLPWIGNITKYHLAKNFGLPLAKPDVHLQRLADREGTTAQALCERLAAETGLTVPAIDTVLWRACAEGVIDSRTGRLAA